MDHLQDRTVKQRTLGKMMIAMAVVTFASLSVCSAVSQAQRMRITKRIGGPVAEKPQPPPRVNAPRIIGVSETKEGYVDIRFQNFAVDVSQIALERQLVTKTGGGTWFVVYTMNIRDHRKGREIDPNVQRHQRSPGSVYVYHESAGLTPGDRYRYRVRATQPYKPRAIELLSAVRTITVKPIELPTPEPTPPPAPLPEPTTTVTKTVQLRAKPLGPLLRPYFGLALVSGKITQVEIPEVDGQPLEIIFLKRGFKLTEYVRNPNATVKLSSGQASTPTQVREIFGSDQKVPRIPIVAFLVTSGKKPNSVAIKISFDPTKN